MENYKSVSINMRLITIFFLVCCLACNPDREENAGIEKEWQDGEMVFEQAKWNIMEGKAYPYRDKMLNDVVYNDTVRTLTKDEILELLGQPDRSNENYLYYMITQKLLVSWPLHTKSMVIKFNEDETIDWIKIHD